MSYTLLRVVQNGVVLREGHRQRFSLQSARVIAAFDRFCIEADPGIYAIEAASHDLVVTPRTGSALTHGMPFRFAPSPFFAPGRDALFAPGRDALFAPGREALFANPASPSAYDAVRLDAVCTLLTAPDGDEIVEACRGIALAFRDGVFVCAKSDCARVKSVSEAFFASEGMHDAPLFSPPKCSNGGENELWAVANAVAGIVVLASGRPGATLAREEAARWNARMENCATRR